MHAVKRLDGFGWIKGELILELTAHVVRRFVERIKPSDESMVESLIFADICSGKILAAKARADWAIRGTFSHVRDTDLCVESPCKKRMYVLRLDGSLLIAMTVLTDDLFDFAPVPTQPPKPTSELFDPKQPELRIVTKTIRSQPGFKDWTGKIFGQALVIGMSTANGKWVCQCACDEYFLRRAGSISDGLKLGCNQTDGRDKCDACSKLLRSLQLQFFADNNRWPTDDEERELSKSVARSRG